VGVNLEKEWKFEVGGGKGIGERGSGDF